MSARFVVVSMLVAALLFGCGGGEDQTVSGAPPGPEASVANTRAALTTTNLNYSFSNTTATLPAGMLKRWALPIPVKLKGEARAIAAVDEIERQVGFTVFDRVSIANTPDDQVTHGLVLQVNVLTVPPGWPPESRCGAVGWSSGDFLPSGEMHRRTVIQIDNPQCQASLEVVIHEFCHALGMLYHFDGFGQGPPISALSWRVLKTIYTNPIGTPTGSVVVL